MLWFPLRISPHQQAKVKRALVRLGNSNFSKRVSDAINSLVSSSWSVAHSFTLHRVDGTDGRQTLLGWWLLRDHPPFPSRHGSALLAVPIIRRSTESRRSWRSRTERGRECSLTDVPNVHLVRSRRVCLLACLFPNDCPPVFRSQADRFVQFIVFKQPCTSCLYRIACSHEAIQWFRFRVMDKN